MSVQSNKNSIKKFISVLGVATAGISLSLTTFAAVSFAQGASEGGNNPSPLEPSRMNRNNDQLSFPGENNQMENNQMENNQMENNQMENNSRNRANQSFDGISDNLNKPYMANTSLRRLTNDIWQCFNSPNPQCDQ